MRRLTTAALIAITAACGAPTTQNQAAAPAENASMGNEIAALGEGQRNAVFIRAIRDAGQDCQHVQNSRSGGSYRGMPVWEATCRGGSHWTIVIADDGTAQILNADQARLVVDAPTNSSEK